MKITKSTLKRIIKEELQAVLQEGADVPGIENCDTYLVDFARRGSEDPTPAPLSPEKEAERMALFADRKLERALIRAFGCAGSSASPNDKCKIYYRMLDRDRDIAIAIARLGHPDHLYEIFMQDELFDAVYRRARSKKSLRCQAQESSREAQRRMQRNLSK